MTSFALSRDFSFGETLLTINVGPTPEWSLCKIAHKARATR
jgi:hypothetical protein